MEKIKLKPKKLQVLQNIQTQKANLMRQISSLSNDENVIMELILEDSGFPDGTRITDIKINGDSLEFEVVTEAKKGKAKKPEMAVAKD